jgi:tetratricopeptide (TPR) repeat protein
MSVAWHPGSVRLAAGGWTDRTVPIWGPERQQELLIFPGISPVAWSPDGQQLAHFGLDGTIKIRDASNGYRIADTPSYRLELARLLIAEQQFSRAIGDHESLISEFPQNAESRQWLAQAYTLLGRAHFARGDVAFHDGRLDDASPDFNEAIRYDPASSEAHDHRGFINLRRRELERAIDDFEKAIQLAPSNAYRRSYFAWQLAAVPDPSVSDPARAVAFATKAVELEPSKGPYWTTLGVAQYRAGEFDSAAESLTRSLELDPDGRGFPRNALFLAMAHWQMGEQETSRQWYDKAAQWMGA